MKKEQLHYKRLFQLYLENKISPAELKELFQYLKETGSERLMLEKMQDEFSAAFQEEETEDFDSSFIENDHKKEEAKIVQFYKRKWLKIASAAAILLFITTMGFWLLKNNEDQKENPLASLQNKIVPGGNKATLTLSNGEVMILDSSENGTIAREGDATILKKADGQIAYDLVGNSSIATKEVINTLTTPLGGQYQLTLSDGSKVWLNAASSIKFPSHFSGTERKVEISGEVYFEIASNTSMPFKVKVNDKEEIEVLGTHFNVMAYDNEENTKTTLVEGSVKLITAGNNIILKPGQQAIADKQGGLKRNTEVNVQHEIAWTNGLFDFDNENLSGIMRQLARWYKVEVVYTGNIPSGHYVGSIKRASKITQVLEMLELAGDVKFSVENGIVIIKAN